MNDRYVFVVVGVMAITLIGVTALATSNRASGQIPEPFNGVGAINIELLGSPMRPPSPPPFGGIAAVNPFEFTGIGNAALINNVIWEDWEALESDIIALQEQISIYCSSSTSSFGPCS